MRLSIHPKDPGFRKDARNYDVFLDGVKQIDVITADEKGYVFRYKRSKTGLFCIQRGKKVIEQIAGEVVIKLREQL